MALADRGRGLKLLGVQEFIEEVLKKHNAETTTAIVLKLPASRESIKNFVRSIAYKVRIFDGEKELPYMVECRRNEEALKAGKELRATVARNLRDILTDSKAPFLMESCDISEGGGWYSSGTRYIYENFCCEV